MKNARFPVLLALAVMLAPHVEASRTSVWKRNPPSALTTTKTDAAGLLASLAPSVRLDQGAAATAETTKAPLFDLGDVVLAESALEREERFGIGPLELLSPAPLRGPPPSYPETRVGGFERLPPFRVGASASLSLWGRQACGAFSCGLASDSRYDPWGLSFWSSVQGYVAGVVEEADPTGLLPEVESIDAGYGSGTRDGEDFDASKTAGKWTLRGLTALKAGAQKAGKFGVQAVRNALKNEAKDAATMVAAKAAGDVVEDVAEAAGLDPTLAAMAGKGTAGLVGAAPGFAANRFHGNDKRNTNPQHRYEVFDHEAQEMYKTGISGAPLSATGESARANKQVRRLNRDAGSERYSATVAEPSVPDRRTVLDKELKRVQEFVEEKGRAPRGNLRPKVR